MSFPAEGRLRRKTAGAQGQPSLSPAAVWSQSTSRGRCGTVLALPGAVLWSLPHHTHWDSSTPDPASFQRPGAFSCTLVPSFVFLAACSLIKLWNDKPRQVTEVSSNSEPLTTDTWTRLIQSPCPVPRQGATQIASGLLPLCRVCTSFM